MNLKPRSAQSPNTLPEFVITGNHLKYTAGNITLDTSKLEVGQEVMQGTAVHRDTETGLYLLVDDSTPADMEAPVLTVHAVRIEDTTVNEQTAGLVAGSVWTEKLTGATDNFKEAVKNRIDFDL